MLTSTSASRTAALFAGAVLLVAIVSAIVWVDLASEQAGRLIRHTVEVQNRVLQSLSLLQAAETGQRGYLLTRRSEYLEPYNQAMNALGDNAHQLAGLIADNPAQQQALAELTALSQEKMAELGSTIDLARDGRTEEALAIVNRDTGKRIMERARAVIAKMIAEEQRLLSVREASFERYRQRLFALIGLAMLAIIALVGYAVIGERAHGRQLLSSRDETRDAHQKLLREASERIRIEDQLRQSQKMEAVGQLTGGIAHDFNNMLAIIISCMNITKRRLSRGETDIGKFIDGALEGAERAATLTHRLLAFSRQQPLSPTAIDANKFVAGMSELLRRTLGESMRLETVLAGGLWRTSLDGSQLENAILNLSVNARDAMPDGGRVTIETANAHLDDEYAAAHVGIAAGQYVLIAVTDTGIGMTAETASKVFEPFFTTKPAGQGTGLGLSQVFGFVKQSGGHIKIYSELGQGTTVKMYFPRYFGKAEMESYDAPNVVVPLGSADTVILVVEDEPKVRQFTVDMLRELGYTVMSADSAESALAVLRAGTDISLLFTDIVMPGANGRKLAEEALKLRPELPVLFTTGYTKNAIFHNGVLDDGVQLISKPFTLEQLALKVSTVLKR